MPKKAEKIESEALPAAETEVTLGDLTNILGISLRTAQRLNQQNVFQAVAVRGKAGKKYYKLGASVQAYIEKIKEDYDKKSQVTLVEQLKAEKLKTEIELKTSQGDLHRLRTEIAKGNYISVEDAKLDYQRFFVVLKKFLSAIPARLGGLIAGYVEPVTARGIEKDVQSEINSMLRSFIVAGNAPEDGEVK